MTAARWLKELYEAHYPMLCRLAHVRLYGRLHSADDVQDVVQDAFRLALEKDIRSHPNPAGWLILTTENLCKSCIRKRLNEEKRRQPAVQEPYIGQACDPPVPVSSDEAEADLIMTLESILSPEEQQLLQAYCLEERSAKDIAKALNITENALAVRIFRLRKRLKKILSEHV